MGLSFQIRSSALPDDAHVLAFRGSEGISRPYVFDIYINVSGPLELDLDDGPGSKVTLTIAQDGKPQTEFHGVIAGIELLRAVHEKSSEPNALYLVRLVPHLWHLSLTKHSRIFTKLSIPDVIKAVLKDEGVDAVEFRLKQSYEPEEHVTQYKESSLHFIHRWMEREGLYYFFEQTDDGEKLIITDDKSFAQALRDVPIPYHPGGEQDTNAGEHLDTFVARNKSLPATVRFTDYDYAKPQLDVKGSSAVSSNGIGDHITYGNRFFTPDKGSSLADIRADDFRAQAKNVHASGPVTGVSSGFLFSIDQHPKSELNTDYMAVTVDHHGYLNSAAKSWGKSIPHEHEDVYRIDLTAILATQQYRHPETAQWPRIDGFENANVDGPATSDYAQIDDQGRYSIKFKFDEGTLKDGKASTFVRKMQPHAGTVEGWHFPERAGTEVVCAFMGGDPDRPVIVGAIPTAIHPSPVTSSNHTKNVIQTGGRNRFEMEDQAGQERVTISTPHSQTFFHLGSPLSGLSQVYNGEGEIPDHHAAIVTDGNSLIRTCGNQDINSGGDWSIQIAQNHLEKIGGDRVDEVEGKMEQTITGLLDQDVHGTVSNEYHDTLYQGVQGKVTQEFKTGHELTVTGLQKITIEGNQQIEVSGNHVTSILGIRTENFESAKSEKVAGACQSVFLGIKSEFVGGAAMDEIVGAMVEIVGGAKIELLAGIGLEIFAAAKFEIAPERINFEAAKNSIHAEKAEVKANQSDLVAMKTAVEALSNATHGLRNTVSACKSKKAGLTSKMSALDSAMNGLTSIT